VIGAAVEAGSYWLAVVAMVSAVISAFLYLRIVVAMYMGDADAEDTATGDAEPGTLRTKVGLALGVRLALGLAVAFTLVVGILPDRVVDWADRAVPVLTTVHR
jgi:NADH-quinone oxidoreductase subunit N